VVEDRPGVWGARRQVVTPRPVAAA